MARVLLLISFVFLISFEGMGQCPILILSSSTGTTCGTTPITIKGNTFGGSATQVTLVANGLGVLTPPTSLRSPFSFTYTPALSDIGKNIKIIVSTDRGWFFCIPAQETFTLAVGSEPTAPAVGPIAQPTCSVSTGSVVLNGLPVSGTWTLTRSPGNGITNGTGTSTTITDLAAGTYTYVVTTPNGCSSPSSSAIVIDDQPIPPSLNLSSTSGSACGTNAVTVSGNRFGGSATSATISENGAGSISPGSVSSSPFSFTYTPAAGDIGNVVTITVLTNNPLGLPCAAATQSYSLTISSNPSEPQIGTIIQPTCSISTGSVVLNGLPSTGTWTVTRLPGGVTTTGSGNSTTISGLSSGSYSFTVSNSSGCISQPSTGITINSQSPTPTAPVIGTVTQPSCAVITGSVILNGLPITGSWTIIRSPGAVSTTGSGAGTTILEVPQGRFTFTVTNSFGCISPASGNVVISQQPNVPSAPVIGLITAPTCALATGAVSFSGLPAGSWTLTRNPGAVTSPGIGASTTLTGVPGGTYTFTVTNSLGCTSAASSDVVIPVQPVTPSAPFIGLITQPRFDSPLGTVTLNGLPGGNWTLTLMPGNVVTTGTGTSKTVTGITSGVYSFTVKNAAGCTSPKSASFEINIVTGPPVVIITNPSPVCFPATVDITVPAVTMGSTLNLIYTYWTDLAATKPYNTPGASPTGTYFIKGTTSDGFFTIKPVVVSVYRVPVANAGPDQNLPNVFTTKLNAVLAFEYESGIWSLISGTGNLSEPTNSKTDVTGLSPGRNKFRWKVTNNVCQASTDSVFINIGEIAVPTLITPNMDGKNDYLILKKGDASDKIDLVIFDRRGAEVYKNSDYNNTWNGIDFNSKQLPDDTYFYVLKTQSGTSINGYIVIRR